VYKLINFYSQRFPFPHRGWKYFRRLLKSWRILNREYRKKIFNGFYMLVTPSEHIQQQLFWYGYYEKPVSHLLEKLTKADSIILDIGAHIGYFTLVAAKIAKKGTVYAFEPVTKVFQRLQKNIEENNLSNVIPIHAAVGQLANDAVIYISREDNVGMSSLRPPENFSGFTQPIPVMCVDEWIKETGIDNVGVIKLDVEGSELFALQGMKQTLINLKPVVIVEINAATLSYFDLRPGDVVDFVLDLGYRCFNVTSSGFLERIGDEGFAENVAFIHTEKLEQFNYLVEQYGNF